MFFLIQEIINGLRTIVDALGEDILFFAVAGVNLLLGLVLLISAFMAHGKLIKKIKTAIALESYEEDFTAQLMPRGANALVPLAVFFFAVFVLLCSNFLMPFIGLAIFELFNFLSRIFYHGKYKKAKKLYELYNIEHSAIGGEEPAAEHKSEPAEVKAESVVVAPPVKEEPVAAQRPVTITPPPVRQEPVTAPAEPKTEPKTEPIQEPKPAPKAEPVTATPVREQKQEPESTSYQPFEPRRPVTAASEYNIERAPGYTVPRPPEQKQPEPPKAEQPKAEPVVAEKKPESNPTIDDIVRRINQIKRDGATRQTMTELIMIIQKEREKNENKNPAERQRLSEALSDLLKTMNKAN